MTLSGDLKDNYINLQQSTGETFASMADRTERPEALAGLDEPSQKSTRELATWLRQQTDDQDAIRRHRAPSQDSAPVERSATNKR